MRRITINREINRRMSDMIYTRRMWHRGQMIFFFVLVMLTSGVPIAQANKSYTVEYQDPNGTVLRQWSVEYDDDDRLVKYKAGGGCSGCGSGSAGGYQHYEYYDGETEGDSRYEGLLKKQYNADGDVILGNVYDFEVANKNEDPNDQGYIYLPEPLLAYQYAIDPNDGNPTFYDFKFRTYDAADNSMVEYTFIDNDTRRVAKYYYTSAAFATVTSKVEYEMLNDDPNDPVGKMFTTTYSYDGEKKIITYPSGKKQYVEELNDSGRVAKSYLYNVKNQTSINEEQFSYSYTGGHLTSHIDARGGETIYNYNDSSNLLTYRADPNNDIGIETNDHRLKVFYTYDGARRVLTEEEIDAETEYSNSPKLKKTSYEYHNTMGVSHWGQLKEQTLDYDWSGSGYTKSETTRYAYDAFGAQNRVMGPDGVVRGTNYNLAGQVESEYVLAEGLNSQAISQTRYLYDDDGRTEWILKAVDTDTFDPNDSDSPDSWLRVTKYEYDFLGRRTAVVQDPNGLALRTTYEYNHQGEVIKTTQPNGKWTKTIRDGRGLMTNQIEGYGAGVSEVEVARTRFIYDANGNLKDQIAPDGTRIRYIYDNFGRRRKVVRGL